VRRSVALLGVLVVTPALANPFSSARYRGLQGSSTDRSGWAIYWNPAALATLDAPRISLHAGGVHRSATFDRAAELNGEDTPERVAANSGESSTDALGVVPSLAGGLSFALSDDFALGAGAGFYIARAGLANWNRHPEAPVEYPGAFDGPQRWGTISTRLIVATPSVGLGLAHKPTGLSLGVAPAFNFVSLSLTRARNPDQSTTLEDIDGRIAEGRILLKDASAFELTWVVGLRWDVSKDLVLAATWHQGTTYPMEGLSYIQFGTADETTANARFPLQVADTLRFGAQIGVNSWLTLRTEAQWDGWSRMDRQLAINIDDPKRPTLMHIERQFEDTLAARLRSDFSVFDGLTLHGGFEYETGATPSKTFEPGLSESDSVQVGVGATIRLSEHLELTSSFIWQEFADMNVTDSLKGLEDLPSGPPQNGRYTDSRQYLTVDLEIIL